MTSPIPAVGSGNIRVQVVHGAPFKGVTDYIAIALGGKDGDSSDMPPQLILADDFVVQQAP